MKITSTIRILLIARVLVISVCLLFVSGCGTNQFSGFILNSKTIMVQGPDGRTHATPLGFEFQDFYLREAKDLGDFKNARYGEVVLISPRTNNQFFDTNCAIFSLSKETHSVAGRTKDIALETGKVLTFGMLPGQVTFNHVGWYGSDWYNRGSGGLSITPLTFQVRSNHMHFVCMQLSPQGSQMVLLDSKEGHKLASQIVAAQRQ